MMLEEDLKSFEAMVGFTLFCIVVMFGEVFDIIPDPYGYIKYSEEGRRNNIPHFQR